jgi:hypothetical protein
MQDLGTLGGDLSDGFWRFRRWLRGGRLGLQTPQGGLVPFAGRRQDGMEDLGTLGQQLRAWLLGVSADGSVVVGWARQRRREGSCLSLDGFWGDAGPRHAGRRWESRAHGVSADGSVVVGSAQNATRQRVPFAGRRRVGCGTSARWAAIGARLMAFPPMAPWWSAGLTTPQGRSVPFAGRRRVGCKISARWGAIES